MKQKLKVVDHKLHGAVWRAAKFFGPTLIDLAPHFVVIHYTAGGSAESSMNAIEARKLSCHLFLDRDGKFYQTVPFNKSAAHAGASEWMGRKSLNYSSVGIEVCNYGWLDEWDGKDNGIRWRDENNDSIPETPKFVCENYVVARHRNGGPKLGWEKYPNDQMDALEAGCQALLDAYPSIRDICGHDEIAPQRKQDPGPAMDMARLRRLMTKKD